MSVKTVNLPPLGPARNIQADKRSSDVCLGAILPSTFNILIISSLHAFIEI